MVPSWVAELLPDAVRWEPVRGGYTRSPKWRVELRDGSGAFVKVADEERLLQMLRTELVVFRGVRGAFLPELIALHDDGDRAMLVVEDLSKAHWPPPYPDDVTPLLAALDAVADTQSPAGLPRLERSVPAWDRVDPVAVAALGGCTRTWLEDALPALADAERRLDRMGDRLVHYDVWAENVCFADRGCLLVDWACAVLGNPRIDVAYALLNVRVESGDAPRVEDDALLPAYVCGAVAVEATTPLPDWAQVDSTLRADQTADLAVGLRWAAEALGLPPPRA